jgi:ParB family transcriptional regulator, chromosome partitioning protein
VAEKNKGMGRGLAAILAAAPKDDEEELRQLPVEMVVPNPRQPRRQFDEEALVALADSLKVRGLIQPILVRPLPDGKFELVAGERRWRAAKLAEMEMIPAVVRQHDDSTSLEVAVIENMAREDLNPVEEARACSGLVEELGLTREEVGLRVGRSRVAVSNLMRLLDLPDEALDLLERRELTEGHGRALLLASDNTARRTLARQAATAGWSVRDLENRARAADQPSTGKARQPASAVHPDRVEAAERISDALGQALGADVKVRPSGKGYTAQLAFASVDEALELVERIER